jgi:membrane-associated protease RseP (regulator of RpoE activity)
LDGGHILYAISPRLHRVMTNILPFVLFIAGSVYWVGWILWGIFLMIPAMRHPKVPVQTELNRGRLVLGIIGILLFLLTFTVQPFDNNSLMHFLHIDPFTTTPR